MTIDRSYLPFESARTYQDRKMAKWMGFFLSEHTTALNANGETIDFSKALPLEEKLLLLTQVYVHQLQIVLTLVQEGQLLCLVGRISHLDGGNIGFQAQGSFDSFHLDQIMTMALAEEEDLDDSGED